MQSQESRHFLLALFIRVGYDGNGKSLWEGMMRFVGGSIRLRTACFLVTTIHWIFLSGSFALRAADSEQPRAEKVEQLIRQLAADTAILRDQAEQALQEMAAEGNDATQEEFLLKLAPRDRMPEETRLRLVRIAKRVATRMAHRTVASTRVTLNAEPMELDSLLSQLEKQTGNRLIDYRESFGQEHGPRGVAVAIDDLPFWPALDRILDAASLDLYPYSGDAALAVIDREPGTLSREASARSGRTCYVDSFRIEAVKVVAEKNLRQIRQDSLRVELEIAWEPRLRPISLSQPAAMLSAVDEDGTPIAVANARASLDVEVAAGSHATDLTIPLELPERPVEKIARFSGQLTALVPGKLVEFHFDNLAGQRAGHLPGGKRAAATLARDQQQGGVTVTLDRVRRNHDLWEIHMRLSMEGAAEALQSHRGWVFQNRTYLQDADGKVVDHAGFETVLQTDHEVGLAYFFDLPDAIENYTWVYRTPTSIIRVPVVYELRDLPLP